MRAQAALVVPDQFLGRKPSCALNIAAFDLPNIDGGIQTVSGVMQDVSP